MSPIARHAKDFTWNRGCSSNSPPLKHGDQIPHPVEDSDNQIPSSPGRQRCQMPGVCPGGHVEASIWLIHNKHACFLTKFAYVNSARSKPSLPYLSTTFVSKCCWIPQKEAPIWRKKRPTDVLWLSMQITFNSDIRLQLSRSRGPGSGSVKSRREANVKRACNIKCLKMKNLIGSLAEDFHCFEKSALSNQKMS